MRKQAGLSLKVAAVFLVILLGLPLANALLPELMSKQIFGFPFSWLFLGVLFFPITWVLSAYYVKRTEEIEAEQTKEGMPE
ncbi:hypothetical protein BH11ARM1_BH11ARM1_14860 [soil metagenome]